MSYAPPVTLYPLSPSMSFQQHSHKAKRADSCLVIIPGPEAPSIGHHFACHLVREGYRRYREPSSGSHVKARERSMSYTSQRTTLIYMPSFRVTIVEYVLPLPCCDAPKAGSPSLCRVPLGLAQCLAVTFLFFQSTNVFGTH